MACELHLCHSCHNTTGKRLVHPLHLASSSHTVPGTRLSGCTPLQWYPRDMAHQQPPPWRLRSVRLLGPPLAGGCPAKQRLRAPSPPPIPRCPQGSPAEASSLPQAARAALTGAAGPASCGWPGSRGAASGTWRRREQGGRRRALSPGQLGTRPIVTAPLLGDPRRAVARSPGGPPRPSASLRPSELLRPVPPPVLGSPQQGAGGKGLPVSLLSFLLAGCFFPQGK